MNNICLYLKYKLIYIEPKIYFIKPHISVIQYQLFRLANKNMQELWATKEHI